VSERWIPILAAVVGLIGGTAGAYIGGYVANQGQEARFNHEDETRQDDLRRTAFADFLQAASNVNQGAGDSNQQLARVETAEAKVGLFATTATQDAASALTDAVYARGDCGGLEDGSDALQECYSDKQGQFVAAARAQLENDE
jgi:hypothetical protein